ncbi:methylglyoxal synthase [Acidiphilium sp. AL]|uniref:Methylglyoxal synthase n=1 Tax=Acidiphilium iwatense TaxID=768198 RepID=A0ABS9DUM9_9PROT|nr:MULTISPECIES: methylglyoxal synthase [Acidiphilium]MCF3946438.1 methylglyoxal synthase [Acidiphilium iwatense]MCU4158608.1 methylglyoxal synthase [Acidiphilium sp. AL]
MTVSSLSIGLGASAALRNNAASPLFGFLRDFAPFLGSDGVTLHIVGATHDAVAASGILRAESLVRLPPAREGGVIRLTAMTVPDATGRSALDWVIYLLDPIDPITVFPEMHALKRQCVVHGKPFLTNRAAASEWCALAWSHRTDSRDPVLAPQIARWVRPERVGEETIGLIAHDSQKRTMLEFVRAHRAVLSRFGRRLATGTTGGLLNGEIPARMAGEAESLRDLLPPTPENWVIRYQSGPRGGDAQIAVEVLDGHCRRLVFFEDPHVAREHEADIQLLERATRFAPDGCLCVNDRASAETWIKNLARLL